jgi:hypothetical protein
MTLTGRRISALATVFMFLVACSHGTEAGLRDKGRTAIGRLGQAIDELHEAAALTGGSGAPEQVMPVQDDGVAIGATFVLDRIAEARRDVLNSIQPLGDSGAEAVLKALESEIANARRRIAEMAGAVPDGPGRFALPPTAKVLVLTDLTDEQLAGSLQELNVRKDDPDIKRIVVRGQLDADLFALACEALLADPSARSRLAPKLSPNDIPEITPQLSEELHIGSTTRQDWQESMFDDQGRIILTPSGDAHRYTLLRRWGQKVNPELWRMANAFLDRMMSL